MLTWSSACEKGDTRVFTPDSRRVFLESYENAAVIVSGVDAADLGRPTPCRQYDVTRLIDHIVEAGRRAAALGRGQLPPPGDESPHVDLPDAPTQIRLAARDAMQAWADESALSSKFIMPWGEEYTGAALVDLYLVELATHAWDLARATGQIAQLDPSLATAALQGARTAIKPEYRDLVGPGSPFAREVPTTPGADDWERLAAFMGRDPREPPGMSE